MQVKQLKVKATIRSVIYVVILAIIVQSYLVITKYHDDLYQKDLWLKNDIRSLKNKLGNLNKKTLEFSEAVTIWESLSDEQKQMSGIRINDAKKLFDELKKKYLISNLQTLFSKPALVNTKKNNNDNIEIYESKVDVEIEGITDELIIGFTKEFLKRFPGYIQLDEFNLMKVSDLTRSMLEDISQGRKLGLIKGKMSFLWYDLKEKEVEVQEGKQKNK